MLSQSPEQASRDNRTHSSASSTSAAGAFLAPDASVDTPAPPPPPAPEAPASDSALASGSNLAVARNKLTEHGEPAAARAQVQDSKAATEVGVGADETLAHGASSGQGHKGPDTVQTPSLHPVDVASASREAPALPARPADPASPPSAAPASPEDLARQLADFRVGSQQPPAPAEPEEEEWALKSIVWPPLPPTPHAAADGEGRVQGFETDDRLRVRIICQNQNGPCSLIALCAFVLFTNY